MSLYPRLAVPDEMNRQRREPDCRFHTAVLSDLVVHPSSCLTGTLPDISTQVRAPGACLAPLLRGAVRSGVWHGRRQATSHAVTEWCTSMTRLWPGGCLRRRCWCTRSC